MKSTTHDTISDIPAAEWDRLANPDPAAQNPFVTHAFLSALEAAGTVGGRTGWRPLHLALRDREGVLQAAMPLYLKTHSQGEYVFDHGWAEAYERAGGRYYPKLQSAVPFTPVPGPRLLTGNGPHAVTLRADLGTAAVKLAQTLKVSSLHVTFLTEPEADALKPVQFMTRLGQQFHWRNEGYSRFEDFLGALASRKRKAVRREREGALESGILIERLTGSEIKEAHWDAFFAFYMDTGSRKWGRPYLNRRFFSLLGAAMASSCLLVLAKREGRYIAGALNLIGGDCLYGRYWGAIERHQFLHFELCYYQAIDYAIGKGLKRVEAGAQGEHKLARGYLPTPTYSSHWIADPAFARAVERYLAEETRAMTEQREIYAEYAPFRRTLSPEDA